MKFQTPRYRTHNTYYNSRIEFNSGVKTSFKIKSRLENKRVWEYLEICRKTTPDPLRANHPTTMPRLPSRTSRKQIGIILKNRDQKISYHPKCSLLPSEMINQAHSNHINDLVSYPNHFRDPKDLRKTIYNKFPESTLGKR